MDVVCPLAFHLQPRWHENSSSRTAVLLPSGFVADAVTVATYHGGAAHGRCSLCLSIPPGCVPYGGGLDGSDVPRLFTLRRHGKQPLLPLRLRRRPELALGSWGFRQFPLSLLLLLTLDPGSWLQIGGGGGWADGGGWAGGQEEEGSVRGAGRKTEEEGPASKRNRTGEGGCAGHGGGAAACRDANRGVARRGPG